MNISRKFGTLSALALALAAAANAATMNVTLLSQLVGHNPDGPGGQGSVIAGLFQVSITNTAGVTPGGDVVVGSTFKTFCIEIGETLGNGSHSFAVNTQSIQGGASPFNPQALESQTAFLYTMYRAGALTSLTGIASFSDAVQSDVEALQDALWFFQNQLGAPDVDDNNTVVLGTKAAAFAAAANDAVNNGAYGWAGGIGNVRVLNVGAGPTFTSQDVLALVPLPQGVGLASAGLLVLGARRRRSI